MNLFAFTVCLDGGNMKSYCRQIFTYYFLELGSITKKCKKMWIIEFPITFYFDTYEGRHDTTSYNF